MSNLGKQFDNVFSLDASRKAGRSVREESPDFAAHADQAMAMGNKGSKAAKPKKPSMYNRFVNLIGLGDPPF